MGERVQNISEVRIDKWLWSVRIFKTRGLASEACRKGRVYIDGVPVKPSRVIKTDDVIQIWKPPVKYSYKVKEMVDRRQSAKLVDLYMEDVTPSEEKAKLQTDSFSVYGIREKGKGRPTKKERRIIDKFRPDGH